jgi:hypothetical protein
MLCYNASLADDRSIATLSTRQHHLNTLGVGDGDWQRIGTMDKDPHIQSLARKAGRGEPPAHTTRAHPRLAFMTSNTVVGLL